MSKLTGLTLSTLTLFGSVAIAAAQPAPDPHHPNAPPPAAMPQGGMSSGGMPSGGMPSAAMTGPAGAPGGMPMMDMGKMMGGEMDKMMPMMRMMGGAMMQGAMMQGGGMGMMPGEHIEGRLAFLKTELAIIDAQLPQWNIFAESLRTSVRGMRTAMGGMMQGGMPTTAPARMDAMVQMMSARLETMKTMQAAAKQLYAVLSDEQKKTADELMTEHTMGMQMGGMRMRGMGER